MAVVGFDVGLRRRHGGCVIVARIRDDQHKDIEPSFEYLLELRGERVDLVAIRLASRRSPIADHDVVALRPGAIKDLPIARWDRSVRSTVTSAARHPSIIGRLEELSEGEEEWLFTVVEDDLAAEDANARRERAEEEVRRLHPDLNPFSGKGAARKWNSLVRLAEVADEHSTETRKGVADPVGTIAERRGVAAATVRSWLHRARQAGLGVLTGSWQHATEVQPSEDVDILDVQRVLHDQGIGDEPQVQAEQEPDDIGALLRRARERQAFSLGDVWHKTDIPSGLLEAIEIGLFGSLERRAARQPYPTEYVPEMIRKFAKAVDLEADPLVDRYVRERKERGQEPPDSIGQQLREARIQHGTSVEDVARTASLAPGIVIAMEDNDFASIIDAANQLGVHGRRADDLIKSYIRQFAVVVRLDVSPLFDQYDQMVEGRAAQESRGH